MKSISLLSTLRISLLLLLFAVPAWGQASPAFGDTAWFGGTTVPSCNFPGPNINCPSYKDSIYVYYPTVSNDDIMILAVGMTLFDGAGTMETPSGWSLMDTTTQGNELGGIWWKRVSGETSGDSLKVLIPGATNVAMGIIASYTGCVTDATPYEQFNVNTGAGTSYSSTAITPVNDYNRVVCIVVCEDNLVTSGISGWDSDHNHPSGYGADQESWGSSVAQTTAQLQASASGTISSSTDWVAWTFALNSTAVAGGARRSNVSQ